MSSSSGDTGGGRARKNVSSRSNSREPRGAGDRATCFAIRGVHASAGLRAEVDAQLARKKAEVNEALKRVDRETRTLRVYVYNTFKPATASAVSETPDGEKTEVDPASWTLHVQGRLLEPGEPGTVDAAPIRPGSETRASTDPEAPKFGGFLRRLSVKIRGERNEESEHAWDASLADPLAPLGGFEVKRVGEADARVSIGWRCRPRVTLTPSLERLLGVASAARNPSGRLLWRYVGATCTRQTTPRGDAGRRARRRCRGPSRDERGDGRGDERDSFERRRRYAFRDEKRKRRAVRDARAFRVRARTR